MLNARQTNRLTAYENVETELLRDPAPYADDEGLQEIAAELTEHLAALRPLRKEGVRAAKGPADDKADAKQQLADVAAEIAGDLYSFGTKTKNRTLQAEADYSAGDLINLRAARLIDVAEHLLDVAAEQAPGMKKLAISDARRQELRALIDDFGGKKNAGREATVTGQAVRLTTGQRFSLVAELLKDRLDRALRKYKRASPEFYARITAARKVVDLPGSNPGAAGSDTPQA